MTNILAVGLGFILSALGGKWIIPELRKLKAGQSIREDGPQSHMVKAGTPTMGGLIFLLSLLIGCLILRLFNLKIFLLLFSTLAFGAVGFVDDYIKVVKKRNLGFTAIQKFTCQLVIALILVLIQMKSKNLSTRVYLPFSGRPWEMGLWYIPFILFVVVGTVNSVNLTDGLDGLSSGVTISVAFFFGLAAKLMGEVEISRFAFILLGGLLGFLLYNKYPAKVFMGDTGSLALGGAIAGLAVLLGLPLLLPLAGGIYFIETLSVIIQVLVFKKTGKRVFLMSPIHHHYEQKGWHETKVVRVFVLVSVILCLLALGLLKIGVLK